jgi:hypothetical protein
MSNKVGILILHGIGNQERDYSINLQQEIESAVKLNSDSSNKEVIFQEVLYSQEFDYVDNREADLLNSSYKWQYLTRFMRWVLIYVLGDASSYKDKTAYCNVHQIVFNEINLLKAKLESDSPIIVVAHSLGVRVISDYIYDEQHRINDPALAKLANLHNQTKVVDNLRAIVSFGCNIPLFETGQTKTVSIKRPNDKFEWLNFFSPFDPLGYKMANYYMEEFGNPGNTPKFITDTRVILLGLVNFWSFWNLFSHNGYWECKKISIAISKII